MRAKEYEQSGRLIKKESTKKTMEAILRGLRTFHEKHEKLKHTVHTAWRYPLPKWGQYAMGCFYFTIPVVGGWYVMQWAISKSVDEIGEHGELQLVLLC